MEYSEIFNLYETANNVPYYNILKKIQLPDDKTSELYQKYIVPHNMPWTMLSYLIYGDLTKYWLILLANNDKKLNPLYVTAGTEIYIVKTKYINLIEEEIQNEIF